MQARAFSHLAGSDAGLLSVTSVLAERAVQLQPENAAYVSVTMLLIVLQPGNACVCAYGTLLNRLEHCSLFDLLIQTGTIG